MKKWFKDRALLFAMLFYGVALVTFVRLIPSFGLNINDLTFNSMIEHLLRGEFDIDPGIVGPEGFRRGGRVYAYWGVFCALIRAPLMAVPGASRYDFTTLSCWIAVCGAAAIKLKTLGLVYRESDPSPLRETLYWALALAILFGGAQMQFLRPSIYQEVCFWAGLLAASFIYFAVRGLAEDGFKTFALCVMAALAGLALLTRVSVGLGLSAALGLLLLTGLRRELATSGKGVAPGKPWLMRLTSGGLLWPALALLAFVVVTGWINYERWGDPLTFANYNLYIYNEAFPDRLARMAAYGLFNVARLPFGLGYYFVPIWTLRRPDGHLLFEEHQQRLIDATEMPPGSFFLTDPLLLLLTACLLWSFFAGRRDPVLDRTRTLAIMLGLCAPCGLMLTAISMNFRYRMDFYPLMELGAFAGFLTLCRSGLTTVAANRMRGLSVALAAIGILGSVASLALYDVSDFGPPIQSLHDGVGRYYAVRFDALYKHYAEPPAAHPKAR